MNIAEYTGKICKTRSLLCWFIFTWYCRIDTLFCLKSDSSYIKLIMPFPTVWLTKISQFREQLHQLNATAAHNSSSPVLVTMVTKNIIGSTINLLKLRKKIHRHLLVLALFYKLSTKNYICCCQVNSYCVLVWCSEQRWVFQTIHDSTQITIIRT